MGRLLWYAGASTALAAGVVISAFNNRANFYSACVYLAQSNLCLMILINLILFIYGSFTYALQRLCYGPLRPIEIEQLYEKAWFAITETCLAMTIFREEVGAWFLVMFVALLTGKVWGWIGEGRVEVLEQQPPANPRLFHLRLTLSLAMSIIYDLWLMNYTISTVIQQARPNMMVMFLFEFAILTTSSIGTALRYCISLVEAKAIKQQTQERLLERRREVREERAEMIRQREAAAAAAAAGEASDAPRPEVPLPSEDDVDEMDIEVPGWEAKGHWVLMLDLIKDFVKLCIYVTFFVILLMFYGLPIHIMRDLFLTARSFGKRLAAFLRYRRATHDMNTKYEDATVEDIQREDTCIICREEMRPWSVTNPQAVPDAPGDQPAARPASSVNERSRPKKLPCGHILHLGCLKSWLERQQVCPTCRRPVVDGTPGQNPAGAANNANPAGQGPQPQAPGQQDGQGAQNRGVAPNPRGGMRMLNFGPLRVGFGQANLRDLAQNLGPQAGQEIAAVGANARVYGFELGFPRRDQAQDAGASITTGTIQERLQQIEQQIMADIRDLQTTQQELQLVQLLQAELARLRLLQNGDADPLVPNFQMPPMPQLGPMLHRPIHSTPTIPPMQRHGVRPNTTAIPAGSADLPPGVTIPEGWSLLPLQRLDGPSGVAALGNGHVGHAGLAPTATTTQTSLSPMNSGSINTSTAPTVTTPIPTINPENHSQASSVHSSDTNAIHTPPSVTADQSGASVPNTTPQNITTSRNATDEPATHALPNWGVSQFMSGASRAPNSINPATVPAPPPTTSATQDVSTHAGPSPADDESTPTSSTEDEERRREKGKAKAVTIEDTVDEAEGS